MKTKTLFTFAALALTAGLFLAPMDADAGRFRGAGSGTGAYLVDTNGDGVPDSRPTKGTGMGANALNFVDTNGNGVCDTFEAGGQQLLDGSGAAAAARSGRGARGNR